MGLSLFSKCSATCDCYRHASDGPKFRGYGTLRSSFETQMGPDLPAPIYEPNVLPANPNPRNFEIIAVATIGRHLVAKIKYPDATNYEGEKILLYLDTQLSAFYAAEALDPHFCEGDHLKPFARFEPTIDGWSAAVQLATLKV